MMLAMLLLGGKAMALGVATSSSISDGFEMDVGDEVDLEFFFRGDEQKQDVTFFIHAAEGLQFDNENSYEYDFVLDPFEQKTVEVTMEANDGGEYEVTWGFQAKPFGEDPMLEQVNQRMFSVEVTGHNDEDDTDTGGNTGDGGVNIEVNGGSTSTSGGGSGAGASGSGSGGLPVKGEGADMQDISPAEGGLSEMVIEEGEGKKEGETTNPFNGLVKNGLEDGEKSLLTVLMVVGFIAVMASMFLVWTVKNDQT